MNLKTMNALIRDVNQNNLYNLFVFDFSENNSVTIFSFDVQAEHEMRMDLISNEIFKSTDYVDFLCDLNDIDNPLNVKQGDIIYYCNLEDIDVFARVDEQTNIKTGQFYLNPDKSSKRDPNRVKYLEDGYSLSPTMKSTPNKSVKVTDNKIIISK